MQQPPPVWMTACEAIRQEPGVVLVLGETDTGKTTWVRTAANLLAPQASVAIVDTDIGQAAIGPPACVSARLVRPDGGTDDGGPPDAIAFVGSVSPMGHALQLVTATQRLVRWAQRQGAQIVLVDTTGLVSPGFGFQVKLRKAELLEPRHVIVLERNDELRSLQAVLSRRPGVITHPLPISPAVTRRTDRERAAYRAARFARYFEKSQRQKIDARQVLIVGPAIRLRDRPVVGDVVDPATLRDVDLRGLLVGFNTVEGMSTGLGLWDRVSDQAKTLEIYSPVLDTRAVQVIQLGSVWLHGQLADILSRSSE